MPSLQIHCEILGYTSGFFCRLEGNQDLERGEDEIIEVRRPVSRGGRRRRGAKKARSEGQPCEWCGDYEECNCEEAFLAFAAQVSPDRRATAMNRCRSSAKARLAEDEDSVEISTETGSKGGSEENSNCSFYEEAAGSPPQSSEPAGRPDLNGRWMFCRYEGDFEAMMEDAGVSWATRKMARGVNYGAGIVMHIIEQEGDSVTMTFKQGPSGSTMALNVGAGEQHVPNEDGAPVILNPRWDGAALRLSGRSQRGAPIQPTKRYLQGQELVCENTTSTGLLVKRFFTRA